MEARTMAVAGFETVGFVRAAGVAPGWVLALRGLGLPRTGHKPPIAKAC